MIHHCVKTLGMRIVRYVTNYTDVYFCLSLFQYEQRRNSGMIVNKHTQEQNVNVKTFFS